MLTTTNTSGFNAASPNTTALPAPTPNPACIIRTHQSGYGAMYLLITNPQGGYTPWVSVRRIGLLSTNVSLNDTTPDYIPDDHEYSKTLKLTVNFQDEIDFPEDFDGYNINQYFIIPII